jgi:hypothetical protein
MYRLYDQSHIKLYNKHSKPEKNDVFWDVTSCGSYKNRSFGGTYRLLHQVDKNRLTRKSVSLTYS